MVKIVEIIIENSKNDNKTAQELQMLSSVTLNTHSFPHKDCQNPQFSPFGPSKCREKTLINTKFLNSKVCFWGPRSLFR